MTKFVALYGGSFNLSTLAHLAVGSAVRDVVQPDEVWYLVSPQNPLKTKEGMASFRDRVEMAKLNVQGVPRLIVREDEKDISERLGGSTYTAEMLRELMKQNPDTRFAYVMGADNFATLHHWKDYQYILDYVPIIVMPRAGYTQQARTSPAAVYAAEIESPGDLKFQNGWYMMSMYPEGTVSASTPREEIKRGHPSPQNVRPEVLRWAQQHKPFL